jgi:hypothetical protein
MSTASRRYRCPLAPLQPTPLDPEAIKREGWRQQAILVVSLDGERLDGVGREMVKRLGEQLYGHEVDGRVDR